MPKVIDYDDFQRDVQRRKRERWAKILASEPPGRALERRPRDPEKECCDSTGSGWSGATGADRGPMSPTRTVQLTLDRALVEAVDSAARSLKMTRSAFTRKALTDALERLRLEAIEQRHRRGYERYPVHPDEFSDWEQEQAWPGP